MNDTKQHNHASIQQAMAFCTSQEMNLWKCKVITNLVLHYSKLLQQTIIYSHIVCAWETSPRGQWRIQKNFLSELNEPVNSNKGIQLGGEPMNRASKRFTLTHVVFHPVFAVHAPLPHITTHTSQSLQSNTHIFRAEITLLWLIWKVLCNI